MKEIANILPYIDLNLKVNDMIIPSVITFLLGIIFGYLIFSNPNQEIHHRIIIYTDKPAYDDSVVHEFTSVGYKIDEVEADHVDGFRYYLSKVEIVTSKKKIKRCVG